MQWVLLVDAKEAKVRQRYCLAHELAHVIWHPLAAEALPDTNRSLAIERIEAACEYFAACLLSRVWMKRAYFDEGIHDVLSPRDPLSLPLTPRKEPGVRRNAILS